MAATLPVKQNSTLMVGRLDVEEEGSGALLVCFIMVLRKSTMREIFSNLMMNDFKDHSIIFFVRLLERVCFDKKTI